MRIYLAGCDTFLEYCLEKEDVKDAYILERLMMKYLVVINKTLKT